VDANGQPLAYLHFEDESVRQGITRRLTKDEARRVARDNRVPGLICRASHSKLE
jgi:hypothetical protein